jgi:cytochrome c oxidase cbb3-type subunit 3
MSGLAGKFNLWAWHHPLLFWPTLAAAILLIVFGAAAARDARIEAGLLRADPDTLPADTAALRFAVPRGARIFSGNCAACHGASAGGDHGRGVPDLSDKDWLYGKGLVSQIQQIVRYGIRAQDPRGWNLATMPAFAREVPYEREKLLPLSHNDVGDIIQLLFLKQGRPADRVAADRGQKIFDGRGACWDCHGDDGHGDDAIGSPNLIDRIWLFGDGSAADIAASIENGRAGVCPAWAGRISEASILEVSLYVYSLSHGSKEVTP